MCEKIERMLNSLPPLNAIRAFVCAARHQSFTLAASELHVTHSAVSRQVKALEAYLGVRLFERRIRQVSLTVEGLRFFAQAEAALSQIVAAAQSVMGQMPSRVVKINVRPSFAVRWLIPRLPDFVERYPGIEPQVLTTTLPPAKATDHFDITVRRGHEGWPPSIAVHPFLEDEACVVAAPALLENHAVTDPGALASCVMLWSRSRKGDWDAWLAHTGIAPVKPAGQMQFEHVHFVLQAAIDGLGFAVAPVSLVSAGIASGQLRCPFPTLRMPVPRYYYGIARNAVPEARFFAAWLEDELAKQNLGQA
ncbi:LysR substrate-binding domain-containing protein [Pseudomonas typographi]|uniref:LysR substrate-binding domain-containing protein n=1 Tax=Pseudomonas typographi TaxID=2715964 RepID=UPI001EEEFE9C|nr:LysR substrate-binding domain-containing protein [Pseudomonas typographi]